MPHSQSKPYQSSLESVVASLVKSTEKLSDEEYDRYIADLILKEAQGSQDNGSTSSVPSSARAASTNKQFLASMIRNVDGHNRHLIRAQLEAARRGNRERVETAVPRRRSQSGSSGNRLRGWSDDEDEDAARPHRSAHPPDRMSSRARSPRRGPPAMESKMDKYFSEAYNPVLDTTPDYAPDSSVQSKAQDVHSGRRKSSYDGQSQSAKRDRGGDSSDESSSHRGSRRSDAKRAHRVERYREPRRDKDRDAEEKEARSHRTSDQRHKNGRTSSHRSHRSGRDDQRRDRHRDQKSRRRSSSPSSVSPTRHRVSSSRRRNRRRSSSPVDPSALEKELPKVGSSAIDATYTKRGSVREWDLGKDKQDGKELMP